jgi:hypothetical protein
MVRTRGIVACDCGEPELRGGREAAAKDPGDGVLAKNADGSRTPRRSPTMSPFGAVGRAVGALGGALRGASGSALPIGDRRARLWHTVCQ